MTISETFRDKAGSLYSPDGESLVLRHNADAAANDFGADDDIARIEFEGEIAVMDTAGRKIETLQDLRNLAVVLEAAETEAERNNALAGQSTRMISNYYTFLDKRLMQTKADNAKARQDAFYMALLQAQLDALNIEIDALGDALEYLNRTGDVRGTMDRPYVIDAIEAWEKKHGRHFDPDDPNAADNLKDAISEHRDNKLKSKTEIEHTIDRANRIREATDEQKKQLIEEAKDERDTLAVAETMAKTDDEKLSQYMAEGMTDKQAARLLAESNSETVGGGYPSFAQETDSSPSFMQRSSVEAFNTAVQEGLEKSNVPEQAVSLAVVPDFMKNNV